MKKIYIKPVSKIHNVRIIHQIAATSNFGVNNSVGADTELTKEHDLWGNEW